MTDRVSIIEKALFGPMNVVKCDTLIERKDLTMLIDSPPQFVQASFRPALVQRFGESDCLTGGLGHLEAKYLLTLALAHAGRLHKYGA